MLRFVKTIALGLGLGGLILSGPASAPSVHAQRSRTGIRKPRFVKPSAAVRVITANELAALLKRDGSRPLLVNLWATWCDPCREEFPDLVKIDSDFRAQGLETIAISLDDLTELKTGVPSFLRQMKARMPIYLLNVADPEPSIKLVDPQWSGALPGTVLYNGKGEIVFKHFGRFNTTELRTAIETLVGAKQ